MELEQQRLRAFLCFTLNAHLKGLNAMGKWKYSTTTLTPTQEEVFLV